jgi:hypothetical protein
MREFIHRLLDCDTLARREGLSDLVLVKLAGYDRRNFDEARVDLDPPQKIATGSQAPFTKDKIEVPREADRLQQAFLRDAVC